MKKLIVYDLDGTLAESKSPLDTEMAARLHDNFLPGATVPVRDGLRPPPGLSGWIAAMRNRVSSLN